LKGKNKTGNMLEASKRLGALIRSEIKKGKKKKKTRAEKSGGKLGKLGALP